MPYYHKYGDDLKRRINGLYKVVVYGKLSFSQDLLFSRVIPKTIRGQILSPK